MRTADGREIDLVLEVGSELLAVEVKLTTQFGVASKYDRKSLHFPGVKGSIAEQVADHVAALPERSFVSVRGVAGPRGAVESAFSRLAAREEIARVRKGLYWKGAMTALGMSPPRVEEVALALGGRGSGPAGIAAAGWLGLTSQVPATYLAAVPARVPAPWRGVRFTQRPVERLLRSLTFSEVAALEVLRAGPAVVEAGWEELAEVVVELAATGTVRIAELESAVADEPHREARARWTELRQAHPGLVRAT